MSITKLTLLAASFLALTTAMWAQGGVQSEAATTYTGKFVYSFTITIESTISTSVPIYCYAKVQTSDSGDTLSETGSVTATRSGSSATCTVTLPYSWSLATESSDKVNLSFEVAADTSLEYPPVRDVNHQLGQISVPANGATTTEKISVVM